MSDSTEINGVITELLPNAMFMVNLEDGNTVKASISGKLRMNYIRLLVGDKVTVSISDGYVPKIIMKSK